MTKSESINSSEAHYFITCYAKTIYRKFTKEKSKCCLINYLNPHAMDTITILKLKQNGKNILSAEKKYDRDFSEEMRRKIFKTLLNMDCTDKRFLEIGRLQPLSPDYVYKIKHLRGLKLVQDFNLYDAKKEIS